MRSSTSSISSASARRATRGSTRPCRRCSDRVAVEQSLVVLRRRQRDHALAVGEHEERQLLALHELLDEHRRRRRRRTRSARASPSRRQFASSTVWQTITPFPAASPDALTTTGAPSVGDRALRVVERRAGDGARRRNAGVDHERFRKRLGRLEHRAARASGRRSEARRRGTRRRCPPRAALQGRRASSRPLSRRASSTQRVDVESRRSARHVASSAMPGIARRGDHLGARDRPVAGARRARVRARRRPRATPSSIVATPS